MNNREKESLLERFEVISRAADDCTYILADSENLTKEELEHKLCIRLNRIKEEVEELGKTMDLFFENINKKKTNKLVADTISSNSVESVIIRSLNPAKTNIWTLSKK